MRSRHDYDDKFLYSRSYMRNRHDYDDKFSIFYGISDHVTIGYAITKGRFILGLVSLHAVSVRMSLVAIRETNLKTWCPRYPIAPFHKITNNFRLDLSSCGLSSLETITRYVNKWVGDWIITTFHYLISHNFIYDCNARAVLFDLLTTGIMWRLRLYIWATTMNTKHHFINQ